MDAIRYLLLALFVTGIYMFIMRSSGALDQYMTDMMADYSPALNGAINERQFATQMKITNLLMDYHGVIVFFTIPILALAGRITFWGKRYFNYTEQVVFYLYTYSHIVIATMPISILLLWVSPEAFTYWSFVTYPVMFFYNAYCYKKCFHLDFSTTILKSLVGFIVFGALILGSFILGMILAFLGALLADQLGYDVKGFFEANFA